MKTIKINEKEIYFSNSWEDLSIKQWIEFFKLNEKKDNNSILEDFYLLSVLEVLCDVIPGELDDLSLNEYTDLLRELSFLVDPPAFEEPKPIVIGDTTYTIKSDLNNITTGEYISIKTLQSKYTNSLDSLPYLLAVIVRPSTLVKNNETGEEEWIQEKFDSKNLDWRANIIYNDFKAIDIMKGVGFFLSGNQE